MLLHLDALSLNDAKKAGKLQYLCKKCGIKELSAGDSPSWRQ